MKSPLRELSWKLNPLLSSTPIQAILNATNKIRAAHVPTSLQIINESAWFKNTVTENEVIKAINKQIELRNYATALQMVSDYEDELEWEEVTGGETDLLVELWDLETEIINDGYLNFDGEQNNGLVIIDESRKAQKIIEDLYNKYEIVYKLEPREFEETVAELIRDQGYEIELTKQTRDGGYDIMAIKKIDNNYLLKFLVECKRYAPTRPVRVDMIRAFKNVISEQNANKGIIVTTSYFTTDAKREQTPYILDFKDKGDIMDWVKDYQQKRTI